MKFQVNNEEVYAATGNRAPDPALESVVFIHGTGQDHTIWVLPTRYFARHGKNVLAIDLPGHGRSGGTLLETIEDMAKASGKCLVIEAEKTIIIDKPDTIKLADKLGVTIIGHSQ